MIYLDEIIRERGNTSLYFITPEMVNFAKGVSKEAIRQALELAVKEMESGAWDNPVDSHNKKTIRDIINKVQ